MARKLMAINIYVCINKPIIGKHVGWAKYEGRKLESSEGWRWLRKGVAVKYIHSVENH